MLPATVEATVAQNHSHREKSAGRRRVLPVVFWLQAGAAVAAAGIAMSASPTANADDGRSSGGSNSASPDRSATARGGAQSSPTTARRGTARPPSGAPSGQASVPLAAATVVVGTRNTNTDHAPATVPVKVNPVPAVAAVPVRPTTNSARAVATAAQPSAAVSAAPAPAPASNSPTAGPMAAADPSIRLAVFGDAGNSYTNGTNFYYSPGAYRRLDLGASGPLQQAVAEMMRSWNPTDVFQLGDESYNAASSSLLDYNIGQYYNDWIHPYAPPAYTQDGSIYTDGTLGGIAATPGGKQWPYNLYDYPNGFPNPADPSKPGGSADGVNHYFAVPGNHDEATILGTYNNASVNQVNFATDYNGQPIGPDAYDYQNNIIKEPPYPPNGTDITSKVGSNQQLLDYHSYLGAGNPGNLKPGSLTIGKLDPNGYGIYYGVDLGDAGDGRPLLHMTIIDTSRLLTDAGYYKFNFAPNAENTTRDPITGLQTAKLTKNLDYDVRDQDLTASDAWFQPPDVPGDAPSIGREMFLWAKNDLEQSDAVWNIVMGHHPAYHVGNTEAAADDSYTSNTVVLNFLQGLHDDTGASLFTTYMNGHSHAYSRVLEMTPSADGIGTGIPFFTIGDGGKSLDSLNLAPYGTGVLSPLNYSNLVGARDGAPLYNYDINKYGTTTDPTSEASYLAPYQAGDPTSVGLSGYYSYSKVNWPVGTGYDGTNPAKLTITSVTTDPLTGVPKKFDLDQPTYLSLLDPSQGDLSGLYGFGSGAAQLDAGDSYLMVHYQTAQPIDPAIALIGRSQGVTSFDPGSLFYKQWSPSSAKVGDLALFSFDVDADGSLTNVQLVNKGNGYFESDPTGGGYLDVIQDFEILGNNPATPLGFNSSDPTRAVVRLTFSGGQLSGVTLVNKGVDYQQVANAIKQCNNCGSSTVATTPTDKNNSLLVGINIDMEAQYTLAANRPTGSDPYHDWYLMTDTDGGRRQLTGGWPIRGGGSLAAASLPAGPPVSRGHTPDHGLHREGPAAEIRGAPGRRSDPDRFAWSGGGQGHRRGRRSKGDVEPVGRPGRAAREVRRRCKLQLPGQLPRHRPRRQRAGGSALRRLEWPHRAAGNPTGALRDPDRAGDAHRQRAGPGELRRQQWRQIHTAGVLGPGRPERFDPGRRSFPQ